MKPANIQFFNHVLVFFIRLKLIKLGMFEVKDFWSDFWSDWYRGSNRTSWRLMSGSLGGVALPGYLTSTWGGRGGDLESLNKKNSRGHLVPDLLVTVVCWRDTLAFVTRVRARISIPLSVLFVNFKVGVHENG